MNNRLLHYAETMKKYRKIRNMSQEDLSASSGINVSTIKKYETGYRNPKYEQLKKISDALGININCFYDNSINTVGELISMIASMDKQSDMIISADKDSEGNYIEESIKISFKNPEVNKALSKYMTYKSYTDKEECDKNIAELFADTAPLQ